MEDPEDRVVDVLFERTFSSTVPAVIYAAVSNLCSVVADNRNVDKALTLLDTVSKAAMKLHLFDLSTPPSIALVVPSLLSYSALLFSFQSDTRLSHLEFLRIDIWMALHDEAICSHSVIFEKVDHMKVSSTLPGSAVP